VRRSAFDYDLARQANAVGPFVAVGRSKDDRNLLMGLVQFQAKSFVMSAVIRVHKPARKPVHKHTDL
jgi:hypothetical protein